MNSSVYLLQDRKIHQIVLDNGIVVLATENSSADIIAARIFIRTGGLWESAAQAGLSNLIASVMTKGTTHLSSQEIAERVESVGASLSADATPDYFLLSLKTVSHDFAEMLHLAGELLRSPNFPETEVELERRLTLQAIHSQREQPFTIAMDQLRQALYQDHPYAQSGLGTEAAVAQLNRADLHQFHQTYFRPDNVVISLVGCITPEMAVDLVQQVLGDWAAPEQPLPPRRVPPVSSQPVSVVTAQETQQSVVMIGYLAPSVCTWQASSLQRTDYIALKLLATYLGNGLSSRLFVELREKRGLAYEVSAFYPTRLETSHFIAYMGTAPDNTAIALEGLQREVDRLGTTLLTPDELQSSKNKLLGQYALGKQTNAQVAQILGWYEILGLGVEFDAQFQAEVAAITAEAAQAAAQRYLTQPYISLVGPAASVTPLTPSSVI